MGEPRALIDRWLREGRASLDADGAVRLDQRKQVPSPRERLRRTYAWIANHAIITPYHDMEFGERIALREKNLQLDLYAGGSFSSFILLPLLTLATSQRLLIVGAPGRGKTSVAILMGMLAGHAPEEVRRSIQRGHPQLTIADLLGGPLPSELMRAEKTGDIRVMWRHWLTMRVKIIDEYNRIPTKTQSALLSLMAEGYAEMYEQVVACGRSAWFLTANDDLGGGTFPVIEALKDRIDVVVRSTPYNARYLDALLERVTAARRPEDFIPGDLLLSPEDLDQVEREVRAIDVPDDVLDMLGFFAGQLDFCTRASEQLEYKNKDTLHIAQRKVAHVCTEDCPLDKQVNLCTRTENGISARSYQAILLYAKALAYFRGFEHVTVEDLRQLLPWVLHEKLQPNAHSEFFQKSENQGLLVDKVSWIRGMFDAAIGQHARFRPLRAPAQALKDELAAGLDGVSSQTVRTRMAKVRKLIERTMQQTELSGPVYEDLLLLKSIHARYQASLSEGDGSAAS